jgi:voltage-gated potassium channel
MLLTQNKGGSKWHKIINGFIITLIILNTIAVMAETIDSFYLKYEKTLYKFELFSVTLYSLEYILRVWTITEDNRYKKRIWGRVKYIITPGALIDIIAIIPFYIPLFISLDLRFLRIIRLVRFLRFFKLERYMKASKMMARVFRSKKEELVLSFFLTLFLIIVSASFMYFIEHDAQPDKFASIPETMWWSVATLTTVGYGDVYPITIIGKILASFISILGIGMFALPAGILASGFSDEFKHAKKKICCPHCNTEILNE